MAVKKHKLTAQTDREIGVKGADLFLAPAFGAKASLSGKDVLDGKGGIDTISAALIGNTLTPRLANIEKGIFTRKSTSDLILDFGKAGKMASVALNGFDADVTINKAKALSAFSASKSADDIFTLNGLDSTKITLETLNFNAVNNGTVAINTISGANLTAMDITLNASSVALKDEAIALSIAIHSNGTAANSLTFANIDTTGLNTLTINGAAALDISKGGSLLGLKTLDASQMTGGLTATLGGTALESVTGGTGADQLKIASLGGTLKATIDLGAGDDVLDALAIAFDSTKMTFIGGTGVDTLKIKGGAVDLGMAATGFETIEITDAKGIYALNADVKSLNLIRMTDSGILITGGTSLTKVTIHSNGTVLNTLDFDQASALGLKELTITGTAGLNISSNNTVLSGLTSFDASAMTGNGGVNVEIGGLALTSVKGSSGDDVIEINKLGGTSNAQALVNLGAGDDTLYLDNFTLNVTTQHFDGGLGNDSVGVTGQASGLAALFENFESITFNQATGTYDFAGTKFTDIELLSADAFCSFDNLADIATFEVRGEVAMGFAINLTNAATLTTDKLRLYLNGGVVGTNTAGLSSTNLSNLDIYGVLGTSTLYLSSIGSANDAATIFIGGTGSQTLIASANATNFVDKLTIGNISGVDILDFGSAFVSTGATITSGAGNGKLVGGNGNDTITSGAGTNIILGSLGLDTVNLLVGGGVDKLIFTSAYQSDFGAGGGDIIQNFGSEDRIDISGLGLTGQFLGIATSIANGNSLLTVGNGDAFIFGNALFIDADKDKNISLGSGDMIITLENATTFDALQLLF